jgi:hypothetical protein
MSANRLFFENQVAVIDLNRHGGSVNRRFSVATRILRRKSGAEFW